MLHIARTPFQYLALELELGQQGFEQGVGDGGSELVIERLGEDEGGRCECYGEIECGGQKDDSLIISFRAKVDSQEARIEQRERVGRTDIALMSAASKGVSPSMMMDPNIENNILHVSQVALILTISA